jgi:hypothetical protein
MRNWYQTKDGCSIQHEAQVISPGKKILLTEDLAALHNSIGKQVEKSEAPKSLEEAGIKAEWDALQDAEAQKTASKVKEKTTEVRKESK